MSKKLINIMIVLLTMILLLGVLAYMYLIKIDQKDVAKEPTIDEILKVSVDVPEITTNLRNNQYVKISFKVQTDGKKAKEEFEKRDFQIQNVIIGELSEMEPADLHGKEGKKILEESMRERINELMQDGKVVEVYITSYIIS
ncbi:flagellar basal body-associated protein FliL [Bacillus sp. FJAT-50079]|uniref:flagellar basal body-associated protein FliL n=1 Tax=Bacillus sp. FJAT-50079 TaxID=2833577 RepID=UPI001BC956B1|nr:flagellar basal body-associated protein FliL [Bacillus sp. FJAT-50079]MBS4207616.1 flagellar basal body-associated protein FliL [Bacillus sp. FJAT-50079]